MNFIPEMTEKERKIISNLIDEKMGIKMAPIKKQLLQSRISKRMFKLNIKNYSDYIDYLLNTENGEINHFINIITTNKTDFFREKSHFDYIYDTILPELIKSGKGFKSAIKIWSAGCSTGEEPYSLAFTIESFKQNYHLDKLKYYILGTDISTNVLEKAVKAVYELEKTKDIPQLLKKKFLLRNKDDKIPLVRIMPAIREKVFFQRVNFNDPDYHLGEMFDLILCRNVLIYFNKDNQEKIINKINSYLSKSGYLMIGHSESLFGFNLDLKCKKPTIYQKN